MRRVCEPSTLNPKEHQQERDNKPRLALSPSSYAVQQGILALTSHTTCEPVTSVPRSIEENRRTTFGSGRQDTVALTRPPPPHGMESYASSPESGVRTGKARSAASIHTHVPCSRQEYPYSYLTGSHSFRSPPPQRPESVEGTGPRPPSPFVSVLPRRPVGSSRPISISPHSTPRQAHKDRTV